jgi:hypothetical protein
VIKIPHLKVNVSFILINFIASSKVTTPGFSDNFSDIIVMSPSLIDPSPVSASNNNEIITKNTEMTLQETKEEDESDAVDNYLSNFNKRKEVKDAPVLPDDNRIEVSTLRKSGRSSSPLRKSTSNLGTYPRNFKESQDIT